MRGRAPPMALSVATCTVLPTGLAGPTRCLTRGALAVSCSVWRIPVALPQSTQSNGRPFRTDARMRSARATTAAASSVRSRPPRRSHGHTGRVHLVAARRVREGGPGRTARSVRLRLACSALLGGRASLARTSSRPGRRGSCRARCQPRTPRADQPGSARSGKPKRVRAAKSAPELIGGRDTFLVPPSPSGRPDCTQRACR